MSENADTSPIAGVLGAVPHPVRSWPAPLVAIALVGALDTGTALLPRWSIGLTALETVLGVPWVIAVLRARGPGASASRTRRLGVTAAKTLAIVLVSACLFSKWHVLLVSPEPPPVPFVAAYRSYTLVATLLAITGLVAAGRRFAALLLWLSDRPARLTLSSFGLVALLGAFALTLPQSLRRLSDGGFVDALFMATSAVCVTGLAVKDLGRTYTLFGQAVILVLIQLGGLGIMALSAFLAFAAGGKLRLRSRAFLAEALDAESLGGIRRAVVTIVALALAFEAVGALLLFAAFSRHPEIAQGPASDHPLSGAGSIAWAAAFHAVSAFCNAGFSLFPRSLEPLAGDMSVNAVLMFLIVAGGIGFPVMDELLRRALARMRAQRAPRLSLHARTAFATSALLIVALAAAIMALENGAALAGLSLPAKLLAALFQSVTARTAGFSTLDVGALQPTTLLLLGVAMFVGASPGSTGGGIKTTTLAALFAALRAVAHGAPDARLFDRTLPEASVRRATAVAFLSGLLMAALAFVLLLVEPHPPLQVVFEAVSAFATVGLSTGITAELSPPGRVVLTLTMLIGRVGPLTLAVALAGRAQRFRYRLPEERILIG